MANNIIARDYIDRLEDFTEIVYKKTKNYLPTISRLCLVSTFIEDGLRMYFQWHEQRQYMDSSWGCGMFLASIFVLFNLFGQLGGCIMVLLQKQVPYSCGLLLFIVVLQTFAYSIIWDLHFLLRNLSLCGGLILIVADSYAESRTLFAGVPSLGENKPKNYLQLTGRVLMGFMYCTLIRLELSFYQVIQSVVGSILMVMVTLGYKTKLSAFALVVFLAIVNVLHNDFWNIDAHKPLRDFLKYDFFQTLSVIGGLLMIVLRGPGGVSFDEKKKAW